MSHKKKFFFVLLKEYDGHPDVCLEVYEPSDSLTFILPSVEADTLDEALVLLRETYCFSEVCNPRPIGCVVLAPGVEAEVHQIDVSDTNIRDCRGNGKIIDMYPVANHPDFPRVHEDWLKLAIAADAPFYISNLQLT